MRTFELVDYTSNCSFIFLLYVANDEQATSKFGKTDDLVYRIDHEDLGKSCIILIDNFYLFPYLFCQLKKIPTDVVGTLHTNYNRIRNVVLERNSCFKVMLNLNSISIVKVYDRKAVTSISTVNNSENIDTGKKHFQTKEPLTKILIYNRCIRSVDANDQLLKYSNVSQRKINF